MNLAELRAFCKALPGSREDFPFDTETLVIRVGPRMYALTDINVEELRVNLKCEPDLARDLRSTWSGTILPGYHMNKEHWNTVIFDGKLPDEKLCWLIRHSYELVVASLTRAERERFGLPPREGG